MVYGQEKMKRFAVAASDLMEKGHVDVGAGRYSTTLFASVTRRDSVVGECARIAAAKQRFGFVALKFGQTGRTKGPRSFSVSMTDASSAADTVHDCTLAVDAAGTFVLVPRVATYHFAVGASGLERRHGRPENLAANAIRATRALVAAAKRADPSSLFLDVHCLDEAA